eukprot:m.34401 g.34401  ORF g.34401 m.34401 type:complete len:338 (+) comp6529_c0_seq1:33-1046(+)
MDQLKEEVGNVLEQYSPSEELRKGLEEVKAFVKFNSDAGKRIALVTSGGTAVPLEKNTVRTIENFSRGLRGASSAEQFLKQGYAVIFFYRRKTLKPFLRRMRADPLDWFDVGEGEDDVSLNATFREMVRSAVVDYKKACDSQSLHYLEFVSVHDYLFGLTELCKVLAVVEKQACLYLAAAVSDFFIPFDRLTEHKIQSRGTSEQNDEAGLELKLSQVPKMLALVKSSLCPHAFVVTFKLETDESILAKKALKALKNYGHEVVVANLLQTRHEEVRIFKRTTIGSTSDDCEQVQKKANTFLATIIEPEIVRKREGVEDLEDPIVACIKQLHLEYLVAD